MSAPWVVVGAEVIERTSSSWRPTFSYGSVKKIAKVYKSGNFVVEGSTQQWDPRYGTHANRTGRDSFSSYRTDLVPLTDAVRAEMEQAKKYAAAVKVVQDEAERLQKVARGRVVEATIAEAAKIIDAAEAQS